MAQTKRIHAHEYAKKLYGDNKNYTHVAKEAFRAGEDNAMFMINNQNEPAFKELKELRQYKKDMEETISNGNLADLI